MTDQLIAPVIPSGRRQCATPRISLRWEVTAAAVEVQPQPPLAVGHGHRGRHPGPFVRGQASGSSGGEQKEDPAYNQASPGRTGGTANYRCVSQRTFGTTTERPATSPGPSRT
jgi:hypothetical protein